MYLGSGSGPKLSGSGLKLSGPKLKRFILVSVYTRSPRVHSSISSACWVGTCTANRELLQSRCKQRYCDAAAVTHVDTGGEVEHAKVPASSGYKLRACAIAHVALPEPQVSQRGQGSLAEQLYYHPGAVREVKPLQLLQRVFPDCANRLRGDGSWELQAVQGAHSQRNRVGHQAR